MELEHIKKELYELQKSVYELNKRKIVLERELAMLNVKNKTHHAKLSDKLLEYEGYGGNSAISIFLEPREDSDSDSDSDSDNECMFTNLFKKDELDPLSKIIIPEPFASFLDIGCMATVTLEDASYALQRQLYFRNLLPDIKPNQNFINAYQNSNVYHVDEEISCLFNIPMSVNNTIDCRDSNGFNFLNIFKYIKNAIDKSIETNLYENDNLIKQNENKITETLEDVELKPKKKKTIKK